MRLTFQHRVLSCLLAYTALAMDGARAAATFLDRPTSQSVRGATWNIFNDSVFADVNAARSARFARVAQAIAPDVWAFQEMYNHSSSQVKSLLDAAQPLGTPAGWHIYKPSFDEHVIASRYPLSMTSASPSPSGFRQVAMALVDLPDDLYARDLIRHECSLQMLRWLRLSPAAAERCLRQLDARRTDAGRCHRLVGRHAHDGAWRF